ncbi:MAG: serine hydrolase domain-containing protein [Gemmatimonadales bacterium]
MRRPVLIAAFLILASVPLSAQALPHVAPATEGFSAARLTRLQRYFQQAVDSDRVAGITSIVTRHGKVVFDGAWGMADRETKRPMQLTTRFRIASQSKAVTSVAAMMLIEEGRLGLGDRVSRFIPEFATTTVSTMVDSAGVRVRRVVPAKRQITVRDLMTQTSGYSYGTDAGVSDAYAREELGPKAGYGWYFADKQEPICSSVAKIGKLPAVAQPGAEWVYGYSSDILGCVIERASGMSLSEFFQQRIFAPLKMFSTSFCVKQEDAALLATVYSLDGGTLTRAAEGQRGQGDYVAGPCVSFSGGAGLVSTAGDYTRFLQMLANNGELEGTRLLSPNSVALMSANQVGTLYGTSGSGFGLGFSVLLDPGLAGVYGNAGLYGWGGAYHSTYWIDPADGVVAVFMTNLLPANGSQLQDRFRTLLYQARTSSAAR